MKKKKKLFLVSNAHLDTQWNWTIQDTIRDCVKHTLEDNFTLFEKYPEYHDTFKDELMWAFKWILGSAEDFYQISLKQITDIYRQYGEYCDKFNYNKRSYYRHLWCLLDTFQIRRFPLISSVEEAHKRMMHCSIDNLSEPKSGEIDDLTSYTLFVERNIEKRKNGEEVTLKDKAAAVGLVLGSGPVTNKAEKIGAERRESLARKSLNTGEGFIEGSAAIFIIFSPYVSSIPAGFFHFSLLAI